MIPQLNDDNLMLVMVRDDSDTGVYVGWTQPWIAKCRQDPKLVLATVNALGSAMQILSDLLLRTSLTGMPESVN